VDVRGGGIPNIPLMAKLIRANQGTSRVGRHSRVAGGRRTKFRGDGANATLWEGKVGRSVSKRLRWREVSTEIPSHDCRRTLDLLLRSFQESAGKVEANAKGFDSQIVETSTHFATGTQYDSLYRGSALRRGCQSKRKKTQSQKKDS